MNGYHLLSTYFVPGKLYTLILNTTFQNLRKRSNKTLEKLCNLLFQLSIAM